jgi:hypothetical protein
MIRNLRGDLGCPRKTTRVYNMRNSGKTADEIASTSIARISLSTRDCSGSRKGARETVWSNSGEGIDFEDVPKPIKIRWNAKRDMLAHIEGLYNRTLRRSAINFQRKSRWSYKQLKPSFFAERSR